MSYFVIIRGPLGSGKTAISKKLAQQLQAEYIGIDEVLEAHGLDKVDQNAPCIPVENFVKANEIVITVAKDALQKGRVVIFDACFYHQEPLEYLIVNLSYPHYVFTLKAPVEVCIARNAARDKTHGEAAARAVHKLVSRFDFGTVIDATAPLEDTRRAISTHLPRNIPTPVPEQSAVQGRHS